MMTNMKTIAVTIDEPTLKLLDQLAAEHPRRRARSALVRAALQEFVERERRRAVEQRETEILQRKRKQLERQARALIAEQARP
jgi:metal-responsive CopG/Arc/MetJ family transcriptional regulator